MTRRSPEVVDGALGFQHHGSPRDASYVWEALDILAEEVRALRQELKTVRDGVWKWIATDNEDPQDLLDVIKEKS